MKNLILLIVIVLAAWVAWHHWPELLHKMPHDEVEIRNTGSADILRLRLRVGGQSFVKETLAAGGSTVFRFPVAEDSDFDLTWQYGDRPGELHWSGGQVVKGPIIVSYLLTVDGQGGVVLTRRGQESPPS
jgi:hypothetical protein